MNSACNDFCRLKIHIELDYGVPVCCEKPPTLTSANSFKTANLARICSAFHFLETQAQILSADAAIVNAAPNDEPAVLKNALDARGLILFGATVGDNFLDETSVADMLKTIDDMSTTPT